MSETSAEAEVAVDAIAPGTNRLGKGVCVTPTSQNIALLRKYKAKKKRFWVGLSCKAESALRFQRIVDGVLTMGHVKMEGVLKKKQRKTGKPSRVVSERTVKTCGNSVSDKIGGRKLRTIRHFFKHE
ncbi:hypothetical protein, unlikely [Trypanosoma brucei gambiense DAL972]|uniref:Uncharacterized protein n=1 Tax=Trypanosoma brucei gambiense (strain MHOM/CI/86/DAL972) TaxID=679716 RepID=C9ZSI2_TRYB9|nr:hypothetical protein, unlikely [Trypanosoma brucei gambiense DAL972]CBH12366.1 hypothetical protein, unlikely [Trypanosoma brucei gambiense DAL972]|eukprot:XP_011774647.1 hypothetical protein, unlikely [Trypanosoma brucei gambiense DAL972]